MFPAACCSFMDNDRRELFLRRIGRTSEEFGGRSRAREVESGILRGHSIEWHFKEGSSIKSEQEAIEILATMTRSLELTRSGGELAMCVLDDIIEAEAKAHRIEKSGVHLHEIGRDAGLMNIASAGLCFDLLCLRERALYGSYIAVGGGEIATSHGRLTVPTPASRELLTGLKFRPGPHNEEMATPTGIAIAKNVIEGQIDVMPEASTQGIGFGNKSFDGERGFIRLFETRADREAD